MSARLRALGTMVPAMGQKRPHHFRHMPEHLGRILRQYRIGSWRGAPALRLLLALPNPAALIAISAYYHTLTLTTPPRLRGTETHNVSRQRPEVFMSRLRADDGAGHGTEAPAPFQAHAGAPRKDFETVPNRVFALSLTRSTRRTE